jgi:hypothetical protein
VAQQQQLNVNWLANRLVWQLFGSSMLLQDT